MGQLECLTKSSYRTSYFRKEIYVIRNGMIKIGITLIKDQMFSRTTNERAGSDISKTGISVRDDRPKSIRGFF